MEATESKARIDIAMNDRGRYRATIWRWEARNTLCCKSECLPSDAKSIISPMPMSPGCRL